MKGCLSLRWWMTGPHHLFCFTTLCLLYLALCAQSRWDGASDRRVCPQGLLAGGPSGWIKSHHGTQKWEQLHPHCDRWFHGSFGLLDWQPLGIVAGIVGLVSRSITRALGHVIDREVPCCCENRLHMLMSTYMCALAAVDKSRTSVRHGKEWAS